ncbi:PREDICTED: fibropellin-1-like [Branchiostoma belcheri]|uniref:Fibropellin-1-like n=1 Tax=Branchiostoma belcheri TaxID=7741 RepID=A0A6P4YLM4_BRABE|nr:PREDICTED: fibropellin-1-like [Branchiostoma belcheri]
MLRMMTSSKVCWVALGCGLLVIASVVTAAVLASLLISKGKDNEGKPDVDDIVKVSASPSWWTTFYKDNRSAFPTSTLPHFSSTLFKDVNECVARPCGHGNCVNYPGGYRCTCFPGWTGQNCQQDINECTTNPCQHGRCENYAGGYSCTCFTGWTGNNCQQDVNECVARPCGHGNCVNYPGGYRCTCLPGWTGQNCQQDINECTTNPCQHDRCENYAGGYSCICFTGWTGKNCQQAIPCQGGWSEYNNHCYKLFKDKVSWSTANERCKQHGANLASVTSADENNFIARLISDGDLVWFGLKTDGNGWKWTDGSQYTYNNWAPGEPGQSFVLQSRKCANMYAKDGGWYFLRAWGEKGEWNEDECSCHRPYVCKTPK